MSLWRLILRSLSQHSRIHLAVGLGVAAATAVLTGALLVGDSVRGSLRDLALDQLGDVSEVLVAERFVRAELADELAANEAFQRLPYGKTAPVILFPSASSQPQEGGALAGNILALGCDERFWALGDLAPAKLPDYDEVVLNQPLADELQVQAGDEVIVRFPKATEIPADSPLARKTERVRSLAALKVIEILPPRSLGRFSLRPNQALPRIAFLSLKQMQDAVEQRGRANAILIGGVDREQRPGEESSAALLAALQPRFEDYGLTLERATQSYGPADATRTPYDYFSIASQRLIFDEPMERLLGETAPAAQPVLTYLVNNLSLESGLDGEGIPYSMVSGLDPTADFPLLDAGGQPLPPLRDADIALNSWTAEQLGAEVGDRVRLAYFAPETTHGKAEEVEDVFTVRAIVPLSEPVEPGEDGLPPKYSDARPPTIYNDPFLTPTVQGITDEATISDWDPPFPYDSGRIKPRDDTYWADHRTTPKALVSLSAARRMWGSRFGRTTTFRVARGEWTAESLEAAVTRAARGATEELGFDLLPVKRQALDAASGTTPFDVLFLFLSFFIITAALILVSLLFQLGVEQRASEAGTLLALGMSRARLRRAWIGEAALVAIGGAAAGLLLGAAYGQLMVTGLRQWWVGAIATPFLTLHVTGRSLLIGYLLGLLVSVGTVAFRLRALRKLSVRRLLAGEASEEREFVQRASRRAAWSAAALLAAAVGLGAAAAKMPGGEAQAGAFVGAGAMILTALLLWVRNRLRGSRAGAAAGSLGRLAQRNAGRNPTRSTLVIGLMAVASFLIVAMSAFRLAPTEEGSGGFALLATSSQPLFSDLNLAESRETMLRQPESLEGATVLSLRMKPGDDASCRNLYRPTQPQVLGVTDAFIAHYDHAPGFRFAAADPPDSPESTPNPWRRLQSADSGAAIPVILDKNTAMYSLHLYRGIGEQFEFQYDGRPVTFRVVGLLANSVLQGNLLIGNAAFERAFPTIGGYRYFLIDAPAGKVESAARELEDSLSDYGFDVQRADRVLTDLLAVQNTYLSTFQSLGLLGLLLGTLGLLTVQLRSVFERRKELALMRATGFPRKRLAWMVMFENTLLLLGGLGVGVASALTAVLPYWLASGAAIPWLTLEIMLGVVVATGMVTGLLAVAATLRAPLVPALRGE